MRVNTNTLYGKIFEWLNANQDFINEAETLTEVYDRLVKIFDRPTLDINVVTSGIRMLQIVKDA